MHDSHPIFPFYLVIDTSLSMTHALHSINEELPQLKRQVETDPIVGDIARFGIVTFSDDADMVLPLSDLLHVPKMPRLEPSRATNYRAAFDFIAGAIPHDMEWFKNRGAQIYRPAVFFITDGQPSLDNWHHAHRRLTDPSFVYRPNIVAFGFGEVERRTLAQVATFKAFAANDGESPAEVLRTIVRTLTKSIMVSSRNAAAGEAVLSITPEDLPNMHEIPVDLV